MPTGCLGESWALWQHWSKLCLTFKRTRSEHLVTVFSRHRWSWWKTQNTPSRQKMACVAIFPNHKLESQSKVFLHMTSGKCLAFCVFMFFTICAAFRIEDLVEGTFTLAHCWLRTNFLLWSSTDTHHGVSQKSLKENLQMLLCIITWEIKNLNEYLSL